MNLSPLACLLKPYRRKILGVLFLASAVALLESAQLALFFPVFNSLMKGAVEGPLARLAGIVHRLPWSDLTDGVALLLGITFAKFAGSIWRDRRLAFVSGDVQHDLKKRLMDLYAGSSYAYFQDRKHGQLIYNVTIAATKVASLIQKASQFTIEAGRIIAIGAVLLVAAWAPTLALLAVGAVYLLITRSIARKVSYHTGKGRVTALGEQTSVLSELLAGIRQVMAFGAQPFWQGRFERHSREFRDLYVKDSIWLSLPKAALDLFLVVALFGGIWAVRQARPEWLASQFPMLALFVMAFLRLLPSLTHIGQLRMEVVGLLGEAEAVQGALERPQPRPAGGKKVFPGLRSAIELRRLEFSYPERGKILDGLEEPVIRKGEVTALVGPSGGGKSTLAYLLLGLLEPTGGKITVDGVDLHDYDLDSWRKKIGFVSQDNFIFHGTVAENIAFGRPGFSAEQIRRAAETANAHGFIEKLPQGYNTVAGERGTKLSGGQQQRIAIARAVLGDPEILVFDEATSFLDTESERQVQEAIERILGGHTVILIAHRLSTVQNADQVVVLEKGRVVDRGKPSELLRSRQGRYYELFTAGGAAAVSGGVR